MKRKEHPRRSAFSGLLGALVLGAVAAACANQGGGGRQPAASAFASRYVEVAMGGLLASQREGLLLGLDLKNTSGEPLWVTVSFDAPDLANRGEVEKELGVGGEDLFACPQSSVAVGVDYSVRVRIFADSGRTKLLESNTTKFRFDERDAQAFEELKRGMAASAPRR